MNIKFGLRTLFASLLIGLGLNAAVFAQDFAYVANTLSDNVSVVDLSTNTVVATLPVGVVPVDIAVSSDASTLAVVNATSSTLSFIDVASNTVTSTINISVSGTLPFDVTFAPDGNSIYVSYLTASLVRNIDLSGNEIAAITINTGPSALAVRPGTNELLVVLSSDGAIGKIDLTTNAVLADRIVLEGASGGSSTNPFEIAVSADGNTALVPNSSSNFSNVVDLTTGTVIRLQEFAFDAFLGSAIGAAITPDGATGILVEEGQGGQVNFVNLSTGEITTTLTIGGAPNGVSISADGATAVVAQSGSNQVTIINVATQAVVTTVGVGTTPRDVVVVSPPVDPCPPTPVETSICASIVAGETFVFGTQSLTVAGTYQETFTTPLGCDSIVNLTLQVFPVPSTTVSSALQTLIDQNLLSSGGYSGAYLDTDGSISSFGNGFSSLGTATAPATKFALADVSKLVTAVLTLKLVEDGVISLSDALGGGVAIPPNPPAVPFDRTIQQLLGHTSGIANLTEFSTYFDPAGDIFTDLNTDYDASNYIPIVAGFVNSQGPAAAAGTFRYSTSNYLLLERKLEVVTGKTIEELFEENIVVPAGITDMEYLNGATTGDISSFFFNISGILPEQLAAQTSLLTSGGAGSRVIATPTAVMEFVRALFGGKILSAASLTQLQNFAPITGRVGNAYGLGIERFSLTVDGSTETFVGHTGDLWYKTALFYSTNTNSGVFLTTNFGETPASDVVDLATQLLTLGRNPVVDPCAGITPTITNSSETICDNESFDFRGQILTEAGQYTDTVFNADGCETAIFNLTLTVNPTDSTTVNATTCDPSQVGEVVATLTNQFGCDSVVTTITTLLPSDTTILASTTCDPAQVGTDTTVLVNQFGCDSLVITGTTLLPSDSVTVTAETCVPSEAGESSVTLVNQFGCDSVVTTITTLLPSDTTVFTATTCDPADVGSDTVRLVNQFGCDSLVITNTEIGGSITVFATAESCDPADVGVDTTFIPGTTGCDTTLITTTTLLPSDNDTVFAQTCDPAAAGTTVATLTNQFGCDSIVTTITELLPSDTTVFTATTCDPADVGSDTVRLVNQFGCDSLVITNTEIGGSITVFATAESCDPADVGVDTTIISGSGCDTTLITTTTLLPSDNDTIFAQTCVPSEAGETSVTLTNQFGCDSVVTTITELLPSDTTVVTATTCDPSAVGSDTAFFVNQFGCDSLIITNTELGGSVTIFATAESCDPAEVGVDTTIISGSGCDTTLITTTTLLPSDDDTFFVEVTDPALVDTTVDTFVNQFGCDSVVTTIFFFNGVPSDSAVFTTINANICPGESFTFGGQVITVGGTYVDTLVAASGADSIVTLNLTVLAAPSSDVVDAVQAILDANLLSSGGISAAVLNADGSVATAATGFAGVGQPNDKSFMYGLADVSQHIYAVLTLKLVEEGVLSLSDQIGTVAGLNSDKVPATTTIGELLAHLSGAANFADNADYADPAGLVFNDLTFDFETVAFAPVQALAADAGAAGSFNYANTNYLALGLVLESLTGKTTQALLDEFVRIPAGLGNLKSFTAPGPQKPASYVKNISGILPEFLFDQTSVLSSAGASGHLIATPTTMVKYLKALFDGDILNSGSLADLTAFSPITGRLSDEYGLGTEKFMLTIDGQQEMVVGHIGDINYTSVLLYVPGSATGVFVSSNNDDVTQAEILEIARQLLEASVNPNPDPCPPTPFTSSVSAFITEGETFQFGTQSLTVAGVYTEAFTTAEGCDSVVTLTLEVFPAADSATQAKVQEVLDNNIQRSGAVTAAVLCEDGAIATGSVGFAGVGVPVTDEKQFGLSDVSQHLVAVLALRLAEEGVISLSDVVNGSGLIISADAGVLPAATIEQLLAHTSGINGFADNPDYKDPGASIIFNDLSTNWNTTNFEPIVSVFVNPLGAAGPTGSFKYSNTGYLLLGEYLEVTTGKSLQELLDEFVLAPAGLSSIEFFPTADASDDANYVDNISGILPEFLFDQTSVLTSTGASGSLMATPEVMAQYLRALFAGQILDASSLTALTNFSPITGRLSEAYGLGTEQFTLDIDGVPTTVIGHIGDLNYTSVLLYAPSLSAGVFVSSNNDEVSDSTVLEIARQLLEATKVADEPFVCDIDAGTTSPVNSAKSRIFFTSIEDTFTVEAVDNGDAVIPAGYAVKYVVAQGRQQLIRLFSNTPAYDTIKRQSAIYTIHTLVYDPNPSSANYLDLSQFTLGESTVADIEALIAGGLCAAINNGKDAAKFIIKPCRVDAGTLTADAASVMMMNGMATISATPNGDRNSRNFDFIYVLTSGSSLVVEQVSATPEFTVTAPGDYTIHTLVYSSNPMDEDFLDLSVVSFGTTTGGDVVALIDAAKICADLDVAGAPITVNSGTSPRLALAQALSLSPNPTSGKVIIASTEATTVDFELTDMTGQRIFAGEWNFAVSAQQSLNLANLAEGIYQLTVTDKESGEVYVEKVVKQ